MPKDQAITQNEPVEQACSASLFIEQSQIEAIKAAKANVPENKETEYKNGTDRNNAIKRLIELIKDNNNNPVIVKNAKEGDEARISTNSIRKLVSEPAVKKSTANGFTKKQHFAAVADIDNLFRNSIKVLTHSDKNNDRNVKAMHRFVAPLFGDNAAFITIKEATEQGKRIYSVELIELGKLDGKVAEVKSSHTSSSTTSFPIGNIEN